MKRSSKVLLCLLFSFIFCFTCIGYAAISGSLTIQGTLTFTPPPKIINYLHVSAATITQGTGQVTYKDGSEDVQNPAAILFLELDISQASQTTVSVTITNSAPNDYVYKSDLEVNVYDSSNGAEIPGLTLNIDDGMIPESEAGAGSANITSIGKNASNGTNVINTTLVITPSASHSSNIAVQIKFPFGFADEDSKTEAENQATVNGAIEALKTVLNNKSNVISYEELNAEMAGNNNYVGNVSAGSSNHSEVISNVFGDTLNSVSFDENGSTQKCTVMLKRFDSNSDRTYDRVIMYLTPESDKISSAETGSFGWGGSNGRNNNVDILVYAVVFDVTTNAATGNTEWVQHGDVYKGSCHPNVYEYHFWSGPDYCDSFDTDTWEADAATYTTGNEVQYNVSQGASINNVISVYDKAAAQ